MENQQRHFDLEGYFSINAPVCTLITFKHNDIIRSICIKSITVDQIKMINSTFKISENL